MNEAFYKLSEEKQNNILSSGIREFATKSFSEANTDDITKSCGISKGLLFHYFGSKKEFYLFCLEKAIEKLTSPTTIHTDGTFYDILFFSLDDKIRLCNDYPDEMHLVNMASRESNASVSTQKDQIIQQYMLEAKKSSALTFQRALQTLPLKNPSDPNTAKALMLYTTTIINLYLAQYQNTPDVFFEKIEDIKSEMKIYLDMMLKGICD